MLMRKLEECALISAPVFSADGAETRRSMGMIRAAFTSRSSEEIDADGAWRAAETVHAVIPARYAPLGGFRRGMTLLRGERVYRMLNPVNLGRLWNVKCVYVHN